MQRCAIYARYSTDDQRATSIADQVARCRKLAAEQNLEVDEAFIFSDAAVTGTSKGRAKRNGFHRLLDAIQDRLCDVVIADEISRLTRSPAEGGRLMEMVEETGIRFVTTDGVDTDKEGWKLHWLFKLTTATHEVDAVSHRTKRGMLGQLQRGYQIAQPAYGYRAVKDVSPLGRVLGTRWEIDESQSSIVRHIYALRIQGHSGALIAEELNRRGVPPPGQHRKDAAIYWRPTTVLRLLANTVYRAKFVWNSSSFARAKARRRRKPLEQVPFERPELRLVSDEDWFKVNPGFADCGVRVYRPRGGGKKLFSGLVRCGACAALCSVGTGGGKGSLYCPQCEVACRVGGQPSWIGYSSVAAAREALLWTLRSVLSPGPVQDAFHLRLEERLRDGPGHQLASLKDELASIDERLARLKHFMLTLRKGEEMFSSEFNNSVTVRDSLVARIERASAQVVKIDADVIHRQKTADVMSVVERMIDDEAVEPYKLKATLRRFLSRFELVARPKRGTSVFRLGLVPGVLISDVTSTPVADSHEVVFDVTVSTTARRPVVWQVCAEPWIPGAGDAARD